MLLKPEGYEEAKEFTEFEQLIPGGHALKITKIEEVKGNNWKALDIYFDTTSADKQPAYFSKNHRAGSYYFGQYRLFLPDENKKETDMYGYSVSALKAFITSVERSTEGFKFGWQDWTQLEETFVGGCFGEEEYFNDFNEIRTSVKLRWFCSIDKIHEQKIPKIKKVKPRVSRGFLPDDNTLLPFDMD